MAGGAARGGGEGGTAPQLRSCRGSLEEAAGARPTSLGGKDAAGPAAWYPNGALGASLPRDVGMGFPGKVLECKRMFFLACVTYSLLIELNMF